MLVGKTFIEFALEGSEFEADFEEWKKIGPRIVTLSPFAIALSSLHGNFGMSGNLGMIPLKAETTEPAEAIGSKFRMNWNYFKVLDTSVS